MKDDTVRGTKRPVRSFRLDREGKSDLWQLFSIFAIGWVMRVPIQEWLGVPWWQSCIALVCYDVAERGLKLFAKEVLPVLKSW